MTDGVRRLTHDEAEMLISARMDEQLSRADSRALLVHLQTCESCRAFAVQSEILGRELEALPLLAPSAIVDRRIRESLAARAPRRTFGGFFSSGGGSGALRAAAGALAVLALVSVYLLIRMTNDTTNPGTAIDAPRGGVAQQIDSTATGAVAMVPQTAEAGPTETPRVVSAPGETPPAGAGNSQPTATLDSAYVYTLEKTRTPQAGKPAATSAAKSTEVPSTEVSGPVVAAAVGGEYGTPAVSEGGSSQGEPTETSGPSATQTSEEPGHGAAATETPSLASQSEPAVEETPVEISVASAEASTAEATHSAEAASTEQSGKSTHHEPATTATQLAKNPVDITPEGPRQGDSESITSATAVAAETPFAQPTIAPASGEAVTAASAGQANGDAHGDAPSNEQHAGGESPAIQPITRTGEVPNSAVGDGSGGSPQIVPAGGTAVPGEATESGVGGAAPPETPAAIPTVDESIASSGLDLSNTVATLPSGSSSPIGRLEFSPGGTLYAVTAPDGQLAIANLDGKLVVTLGMSELPVWSGPGMMFSTPGDNGSVIGIWNSDNSTLSYVPSSPTEASDDVPIGGGGQSFYFLRSFPNRPGALEIHRATIDGTDAAVIWKSDSVELGGVRPVWSSNGILLPTDTSWLLIDFDGTATEIGRNPFGFVGVPVLSPGEGLLAYSAGDQVIIAWTNDPGTAVAKAPFGGTTGGYAFANTGEEIVVSDGSALHVVSYQGDDLGTLSGNRPIGAVYWNDDTIYYVQTGKDAALRSTSLSAIQSGG